MRSGRCGYAAIDTMADRTTSTNGYHLRMTLSSGLALRLHPFEHVLDQVVEHRGIELVDHLLSAPLREDESCLAERREMPRHRRPRRRKSIGDLAGRFGSVTQHLDDLSPSGIGERFERSVH